MNWQQDDYRPSPRPLTRSSEVSERVAYLEATIEHMNETLASLRARLSHAEQFHDQTLEYRLRLEHQISNMTGRMHALTLKLTELETHKEDQAEQTEKWMNLAKWAAAAVLALATLMGKMQTETVTKIVDALLK